MNLVLQLEEAVGVGIIFSVVAITFFSWLIRVTEKPPSKKKKEDD